MSSIKYLSVTVPKVLWDQARVYSRLVGLTRTEFTTQALHRYLAGAGKDRTSGMDQVLKVRTRLPMPTSLVEALGDASTGSGTTADDLLQCALRGYLRDLPCSTADEARNPHHIFAQHVRGVAQHVALERGRLWSRSGPRSDLVMLTMCFNHAGTEVGRMTRSKANNLMGTFDQFYRHLCSRILGNNWHVASRRHLQPLTWAWIDVGTGSDVALSPCGRRSRYWSSVGDVLPRGDLEDLPHIHCVMLVHPDVVGAFRQLLRGSGLDGLLTEFSSHVRDVHAQLIASPDIKRVVRYCAKYLRRSGGNVHASDLYNVWPRAIAEARPKAGSVRPLASAAASKMVTPGLENHTAHS